MNLWMSCCKKKWSYAQILKLGSGSGKYNSQQYFNLRIHKQVKLNPVWPTDDLEIF